MAREVLDRRESGGNTCGIKTSVLLFDFGESMALDLPESLHLAEALDA
jgi:hypothetical protein